MQKGKYFSITASFIKGQLYIFFLIIKSTCLNMQNQLKKWKKNDTGHSDSQVTSNTNFIIISFSHCSNTYTRKKNNLVFTNYSWVEEYLKETLYLYEAPVFSLKNYAKLHHMPEFFYNFSHWLGGLFIAGTTKAFCVPSLTQRAYLRCPNETQETMTKCQHLTRQPTRTGGDRGGAGVTAAELLFTLGSE